MDFENHTEKTSSDTNQTMSKELTAGDKAPAFTAMAVGGKFGDGAQVSLAHFAGQTVVHPGVSSFG